MDNVKFFVANSTGFANAKVLYATDNHEIEQKIRQWYSDPYEDFYEISESEAKKILYLQGETHPRPQMNYVKTDFSIHPSVDGQIKMMIESATVEFTQYE